MVSCSAVYVEFELQKKDRFLECKVNSTTSNRVRMKIALLLGVHTSLISDSAF